MLDTSDEHVMQVTDLGNVVSDDNILNFTDKVDEKYDINNRTKIRGRNYQNITNNNKHNMTESSLPNLEINISFPAMQNHEVMLELHQRGLINDYGMSHYIHSALGIPLEFTSQHRKSKQNVNKGSEYQELEMSSSSSN
jgi:hypothetical protein